MNLKFIGLSLILVLTALSGFGFGGEIFAAGEGWCAPVNFGSARITAAAVGTPDRGNGVFRTANQIKRLRQHLQKLIREENYEEAATVRDEIRAYVETLPEALLNVNPFAVHL